MNLILKLLRKLFPPVKPISELPEPEEIEDKDDSVSRHSQE